MEIRARDDPGGGRGDQVVKPIHLRCICSSSARTAFADGVFSKFDSIQDGSVAVLTPHTAFVDPTTPPGAEKRLLGPRQGKRASIFPARVQRARWVQYWDIKSCLKQAKTAKNDLARGCNRYDVCVLT